MRSPCVCALSLNFLMSRSVSRQPSKSMTQVLSVGSSTVTVAGSGASRHKCCPHSPAFLLLFLALVVAAGSRSDAPAEMLLLPGVALLLRLLLPAFSPAHAQVNPGNMPLSHTHRPAEVKAIGGQGHQRPTLVSFPHSLATWYKQMGYWTEVGRTGLKTNIEPVVQNLEGQEPLWVSG